YGAQARLRLHVKGTTQTLDLGCDDVHANAATGLLSDGARSRETGLEDQLHCVLVAQALPRGNQSECRTLVANGLEIHAAPIVGQAHHDLGTLTVQLENDAAHLGLAESDALARLLDSMHDRVAQHVLERRQHPLQNLAIELARGTLHRQVSPLSGVARRL